MRKVSYPFCLNQRSCFKTHRSPKNSFCDVTTRHQTCGRSNKALQEVENQTFLHKAVNGGLHLLCCGDSQRALKNMDGMDGIWMCQSLNTAAQANNPKPPHKVQYMGPFKMLRKDIDVLCSITSQIPNVWHTSAKSESGK